MSEFDIADAFDSAEFEDGVKSCSPDAGWNLSAESIVCYLRALVGLELWMLTRTDGDDWTILKAADTAYNVRPGQVLRWSDSFCSRMVRGDGPRFAPDVSRVPIYRDAPVSRQLRIGSYIGVPLNRPDGSMIGTLCAVGREAISPEHRRFLPLAEACAELASEIWVRREQATRRPLTPVEPLPPRKIA